MPGSLKAEDLDFILGGGRIFVKDPYGLSSWTAKLLDEWNQKTAAEEPGVDAVMEERSATHTDGQEMDCED